MTEVWKDIDGYEGLYQVSNLGNVKSLKFNKERILKPGLSRSYLMAILCKEGNFKGFRIHQLVAKAFISNPNGYTCVNHKNEVKTDNRVENLEWCEAKYNANYGTRNERIAEKLSKPIYCVELDKVFSSIIEAERQTGIYHGSITKCLKGRLKSAGGYHWEYI